MKKIFLLSIIAAMGIGGFAQSHPAKVASEGKVHVVNGDTIDGSKVYQEFAEVAPAAFNVPSAPRFAFVGKDRKFYLGLGGAIKGTISYDFGDPITNPNEFTTSAINMNPAPGNGGLVQLSAQQSSFFVNFIALPDNPNKVGVYIQGNFLGSGYGFQLQYAYAKYRGFTVGYDYSLFTDVAAAPPTIDYEGPNSFTAIPNAVLDYRHSFNKWLSMGVGLELPQASYTTSEYTRVVNQRVPDIPAYVQFNWASNSWVRLSGIIRNIAYYDNVQQKTQDAVGWGIKLSGSAALLPGLTAYYQGAYGVGLTSYFQDLNGMKLDLVPDEHNHGHLKAVKAYGWYAGLQYNFSPKVFCSGTYSMVRTDVDPWSDSLNSSADRYKLAHYVVGNVFYNINSIVQVGLEYIWGSRMDMNSVQKHDNRIQAMLQVTF